MKWFLSIIGLIIIVTLLLVVFSLYKTAISNSLWFGDICFESNCILYFAKTFKGTTTLLGYGVSTIWIFVLTSGVYIALKNYLTSVKSTALSSHISHLTMFKDFICDEVERHNHLKQKDFDVFKWYKKAFPNSTKGDIEVAQQYEDLISNVRKAIVITNESINSPKGEYGYRKHQDRIIIAMRDIGIELTHLPRNNFHDVELELFKLLDSVNQTFTNITITLNKEDRAYI